MKDSVRFGLSVLAGLIAFLAGLRLTSEVTVILAATVLTAGAISMSAGRRPWLWGLAVGLGTRLAALFPEPPLSPDHLAREGRSQPLPLPFGLTGNAAAQHIAGSFLIMLFPLVGSFLGWLLHKAIRWGQSEPEI